VLYLDSSALIKHYIREKGSDEVNARIASETAVSAMPFTSVLAYAEVHATIARKAREKLLSGQELKRLWNEVDSDWAFGVSAIALDAGVLVSIREIVSRFPLRGSDAVHLASALWLRDTLQASKTSAINLTFATSDLRLADAALRRNLEVFNPQTV
jgi:predicted nucleic acid-binding protein